MTTTINNKPTDMKQLWQQMEPCPSAASALSSLTTSEDGSDRYMYYIVGALFYRYDTIANSWMRLATPLFTPTVFVSLRYSKYSGQYGRVISAPTSTKLRIAGFNTGLFDGYTIRIISGAGAGQVRTILTTPEPVKYEQGLTTSVSASVNVADSTKKWKINQWAGYQLRLTFANGATQIRKILYNDTTTIYWGDTNYQPIDSFNNAAPVPLPNATAGAQTHFVIEATDITINSAWTVTPDYTSRYKIESGGVWMLTQAAGAPFYNLHYYDVIGDYWVIKTAASGLITALFATDGSLERTGEIGGIYQTGTATAGATYTLTRSGTAWVVDQYKNYRVRITGGTGVGQSRRIIANGTVTLEVARKWDVVVDATSTFEIIADKDKIYIAGNAQSALFQHDIDSDLPLQASKCDDGIANSSAVMFAGLEQAPVCIQTGVRSTGGITVINATPTAGGTNYLVGDILTISTGGTNGKVIVESISVGGIITSVSLFRSGATYTTGSGKATTGGTGSGATVDITTVGTVGLITTQINHFFKIGDSIVLFGDALWAGTYTIIGSDNCNTIDIAISAAGNVSPLVAQSATVIVDSTKNWTVNEHVGKILQTHLVGVTGVMQPRVILSNTATSITVATITTPLVNGTGRYVITESSAFGRDEAYKDPTKANYGYASGGSTTTLIDSTKNWKSNQWAGARIRISAGVGRDAYFTITSNTATTLTYGVQSFTPDATTKYLIFDCFGTASSGTTTTLVDTTQTWAINQWAGKRVRILAGSGFGIGVISAEALISANTATTLTFSTIGASPDTTSQYCILGIPVRNNGIDLVWAYGGSSAGRYMYCARGLTSNTLDRYDITKETWEYGFLISPQSDIFGSGSYYAYDGVDGIYMSPGVATTLVQYVNRLNLLTNKMVGFGSVPNTQLAPTVGNRMEIIESAQGIQYLYHMRNSGNEMYRAMIWY